jgi:hypothetical protein
MMRDFTKIPSPWKNATKVNGVQQCLVTTAGNLKREIPAPYKKKATIK